MSKHEHKPITKVVRDLPSYTLGEAVDLPPPTWLAKDILPDGGLSVMVGPPGIGKTFCAVDLAMSVAYGMPWMGREVRQGRVVYIAAEGHRSVARRMLAWCAYHGMDTLTEDLIIIPDAVNMLGADAVADQFFEAVLDKFPVQTRTWWDDDGEEQQEPLEGAPIRLIVFDTLARCMLGGDENSAEDMGAAIAFCDHLRRVSNYTDAADTHVMLIHHTNKAGTAERGSTALRGACDTMLNLTRKKAEGIYTLSALKQRDADEGQPISIEMYEVPAYQSAVVTAKDFTFQGNDMRQFVKIAKGVLTPRQEEVLLAHLIHFGADGPHGLGAGYVGKVIGMAASNVSYYRGALREHGYLVGGKGGRTSISAEGVKYLFDRNKLPADLSNEVRDIVTQALEALKEVPALPAPAGEAQ